MEARISRRITTLERATRFVREHPVPVSHVTTLIDSIDAIVAELYHSAGQQSIGHASFRSGAAIRASHAAELLALMRSVNRIARALDPNEFPGLRVQFRMPRGDGYQRLLSHAAAFAQAAQPILAIFLERGLEPDFIQQILARREEIHAGLTIKNNGFSQRLSGTASLAALTRRAMPLLRELDAILIHQYRLEPALLAAWKGACHVECDPQRTAIPVNSPPVPDPNPAKVDNPNVVEKNTTTEQVHPAPNLASFPNHESPPSRLWRLHPYPDRLPHLPR